MPHISLAQIEVLRTLLRRLSMENLDLGNDQVMTITSFPGGGGGSGGRSERADEFIKRRTARWREIWLERPLAMLIADLGATPETTRSTGAEPGPVVGMPITTKEERDLQPKMQPGMPNAGGIDIPQQMKPGNTFTGEVTDNTGKKFRIYGKAEE